MRTKPASPRRALTLRGATSSHSAAVSAAPRHATASAKESPCTTRVYVGYRQAPLDASMTSLIGSAAACSARHSPVEEPHTRNARCRVASRVIMET